MMTLREEMELVGCPACWPLSVILPLTHRREIEDRMPRLGFLHAAEPLRVVFGSFYQLEEIKSKEQFFALPHQCFSDRLALLEDWTVD